MIGMHGLHIKAMKTARPVLEELACVLSCQQHSLLEQSAVRLACI